MPKGSSILFDVADERLFTEQGIFNRVQHMVQMAAAFGELMKFSTRLPELEQMLAAHQLFIYEHLAIKQFRKKEMK